MTEYVCYSRYKGPSYSGNVVVPYGAKLYSVGYAIFLDSRMFGYTTSQACYDHFVRDDDGQGLQRGRLILTISKILYKHSDRWARLSSNLKLQKFRRPEHQDVFVWNFKFYNATIEELKYIYSLVK